MKTTVRVLKDFGVKGGTYTKGQIIEVNADLRSEPVGEPWPHKVWKYIQEGLMEIIQELVP